MKNYIYFLAAILLSCSFAYSSDTHDITKQIALPHHRVYVGPDIFFDHMSVQYHSGDSNVHASSNAVFGGLRMGYDYLKPRTFYFGTDGLIAIGKASFKAYSTYWWEDNNSYSMRTKNKTSPLFTNIEQRYGYTFQSPISAKSTLVPFAGIGWYYTKSKSDTGTSLANWFYGAAGLRIFQQFCKNFDVGFNLKAMYAFTGKQHVRTWNGTCKERIRDVWGYEVALPLTWHVEASKKWDAQFEPYLLKLDVSDRTQILGARLLAGYSF